MVDDNLHISGENAVKSSDFYREVVFEVINVTSGSFEEELDVYATRAEACGRRYDHKCSEDEIISIFK